MNEGSEESGARKWLSVCVCGLNKGYKLQVSDKRFGWNRKTLLATTLPVVKLIFFFFTLSGFVPL